MLLEFSVFHNFTANTNFFFVHKKKISGDFQLFPSFKHSKSKCNFLTTDSIPTNHRQLSGCVYFQTNQSDLSVQIITEN